MPPMESEEAPMASDQRELAGTKAESNVSCYVACSLCKLLVQHMRTCLRLKLKLPLMASMRMMSRTYQHGAGLLDLGDAAAGTNLANPKP